MATTNKIAEIISDDGEVVSLSNFGSQEEFEFKILNSFDFDTMKSFFIKKTLIEAIRAKHNSTNGSNGATIIELSNLFKWNDILVYLNELESKKFIEMRKGINSDMYFIYKK
jgi:hypothetical protein